jgi:hypothetical protein
MKNLSIIILLCAIPAGLYSQELKVFEEWTTGNGVQEMFLETFTETDASNNVYVGGATMNSSGDYDMILSKYNNRGVLLWTETYAGTAGGDDVAAAMCFGTNGEIFVTGSVYAGSTNDNDCVVLCYDSSGNLDWDETFNGSASFIDFGSDIIVDADNVIFVTGATSTTN